MDNKILAIIAVAILAIAAVAVALIMTNQGSEPNNEEKEDVVVQTGRLVVYGNANNDDTIDEADLKLIQSMVDGKMVWNKTTYPFADTNADGKMTQEDVTLVKKLINKETCTAYYLDKYDEAVAVTYPATGSIGVMYWEQAQIIAALGLWDRVTACDQWLEEDFGSDFFPDLDKKYIWGTGYNATFEQVRESGVDNIVCYTGSDGTCATIKEAVKESGYKINIFSINMQDPLTCMVTYGFLFDSTEKAAAYAKYADEAASNIQSSLSSVSTEDQPSVATVIIYKTTTTDKIFVFGYPGPNNSAEIARLVYSIPNVNWVRADADLPAYRTQVTSEWFIENDPDYIIVLGSGMGASPTMTDAEVRALYDAKIEELFGGTSAYKNGHIVCTPNPMLSGAYGPLIGLELLSNVYSQLDSDLADKIFDATFKEFTVNGKRLSIQQIFVVEP